MGFVSVTWQAVRDMHKPRQKWDIAELDCKPLVNPLLERSSCSQPHPSLSMAKLPDATPSMREKDPPAPPSRNKAPPQSSATHSTSGPLGGKGEDKGGGGKPWWRDWKMDEPRWRLTAVALGISAVLGVGIWAANSMQKHVESEDVVRLGSRRRRSKGKSKVKKQVPLTPVSFQM